MLLLVSITLLCLINQIAGKTAIVCHKSTYASWKSDLHHRFDEQSRWDCPSTSCGGQCVALLKCNCGAPYTGLWSPGQNVATCCKSGNCNIKHGTAIATFEGGHYHNRVTDHAAVFLGCTTHGHFQAMEQGCSTSVQRGTYTPTNRLYSKLKVIMTNPGNIVPNHRCARHYKKC